MNSLETCIARLETDDPDDFDDTLEQIERMVTQLSSAIGELHLA